MHLLIILWVQIFQIFLVSSQIDLLLNHQLIDISLDLVLQNIEYIRISLLLMKNKNSINPQIPQRFRIVLIHSNLRPIRIFEETDQLREDVVVRDRTECPHLAADVEEVFVLRTVVEFAGEEDFD